MTVFNLKEDFGKYQFNKVKMRERLPKPVFEAWQKAAIDQQPIEREIADAIAHAMKIWALELGATHFCHWFQPLNGKTAEKHDSFIQGDASGLPLARFSGKALILGETDGSSFPTGGLRDTFEARGYTFWDVSSYAYVRGHVLYIPSVFISYRGEKLDLKLPLLNAKNALSRQATRVLRLMGRKDVEYVTPNVGLEQEYFLVDLEKAKQRPDIRFCDRTLFSADIPKGGDFEDTYFTHINDDVQRFMQEVNEECWKLGINAQVEHNENAPGQYEFSSIFDDAITTIDQNMIVMEILKSVARRHGYACLLHEKPFSGMNGSGKHNNFSLTASNGDNLFDPGDRQPEDLQFLVFIAAFIAAVDKHAMLLRMGACDEHNDHRLGGDEAPPAIISIYLGAPLHHLFQQLARGTDISPVQLTRLIEPVISLSEQAIEATDRNRTSPVTFSGNKFEIRMLGSSLNASSLNTFLFAAMAEALDEVATKLEQIDHSDDAALHRAVMSITHEMMKAHERVLFAGDGYKKNWVEEATRRGLPQSRSYVESIESLRDPKTIALLERYNVLNEQELSARYEILRSDFIHVVKLQARILNRMAAQGVYPALLKYQTLLEQVVSGGISRSAQRRAQLNAHYMDEIDRLTMELEALTNRIIAQPDKAQIVSGMLSELRPKMEVLTRLLNEVELNTPYDVFPYPTQDDLVIQ